MAEQEKRKFIKLNKDVLSECKNLFCKGSTVQVLVEPTKYDIHTRCLAVKAFDEENLPYPNDYRVYNLILKENDFVEVEPMERKSYSVPTGFSFFEDDNEPLDLGLEDRYSKTDWKIDKDGNIIPKTASLKKESEVGSNMLTDSSDNISTEFAERVEGQDDPGVSEPWTANEKEMPATAPILGELTAKAQELQRLLAGTEENRLTESNKDITTDFDTSVGGSGQVKDVYKEDTKEMPWKDENLGETSAQKKMAVTDSQKIKDLESNIDSYQEDEFEISAEDLGLSPEQEADALKDIPLEEGHPENVYRKEPTLRDLS